MFSPLHCRRMQRLHCTAATASMHLSLQYQVRPNQRIHHSTQQAEDGVHVGYAQRHQLPYGKGAPLTCITTRARGVRKQHGAHTGLTPTQQPHVPPIGWVHWPGLGQAGIRRHQGCAVCACCYCCCHVCPALTYASACHAGTGIARSCSGHDVQSSLHNKSKHTHAHGIRQPHLPALTVEAATNAPTACSRAGPHNQ